MHNGSVDPRAKPLPPRPLVGTATGVATATGLLVPAARPPWTEFTNGMSFGRATVVGLLDVLREQRDLFGQAAGVATTLARPAMHRDLTGYAQGFAIAAYMTPAESACQVTAYGLPVTGTEPQVRLLYLCLMHQTYRSTSATPSLVDCAPLDQPEPCDDCNPWYRANSAPIIIEPQPLLLDVP